MLESVPDHAAGGVQPRVTGDEAADDAPETAPAAGGGGIAVRREAEEQRLRAALDTVLDAYAIYTPAFDAEGRYADSIVAYTNLAWRVFFLGYDAPDIEGRSVYDLLPSLRSRFELHARTAETGEPFRGVVEVHTPRGSRWAELSMQLVGSEIVAFTRDITTQRETEAALVESREMLRQAMDGVIEGYAIYRGHLDAAGRYVDATVVYANETWKRQFSPDDPEVEGRSLYSFPGARVRFETHARVFETGEPFRGLVEVRQAGEVHTLDLQMVKFGNYFVGSSRDMTDQLRAEAALRDSERRHREVVDGIDAVVWDEGAASGAFFMSRQAETLFGFPVERFSDARFWRERLHPEDRQRAVDAMWGPDDVELEYRWRVASGEYRWFRDKVTVVRDVRGQVVRRYGITIDITERRDLQERLRQSERLSSVGQLAANVSHDFNNTLWGIRMFADRISAAHPEPDDPDHEAAEKIISAVDSATELTRSLLAFSKDSPRVRGSMVIDDVIRPLGAMLQTVVGSGVTTSLRLHAPGEVVVGEPGGMEQVLLNLVINARDAMPSGGRLAVETRVVTLDDEEAAELDAEPGRGVILNVADTGVGMDDDTRAKAFIPYFTTKEVGQGTGLGLATVFGTVKAAGGGIAIESAPGRGTTVRIFLPSVTPAA